MPIEINDSDLEPINDEINDDDLIPASTQVPHSWVQGGEPSLYDKFMRIFDDPEKESAKAVTALVNANSFNITPSQAYDNHDELQKMTKGQKLQKPRIGTAFKEGVQESTPGIIYSQKIPDFEPLGTWEEIAYSFGSILPSLPIYAAGYTIGGGNPLTGTAGAFALDAGIRQVYIDKIQKGEINSFAEFTQRLDSAVRETAKGEIIGSLTGAAGLAVPAKAKLLTELGTMTTVGSLLDGRIPGVKDFVHGGAVLGMLHVSGKAPNFIKNRMYEAFKKNNSHPVNLANEVNKRIEEYDIRPITDILLDLEPTKESEVYRYEPEFKGEKSPVAKTVEQLLTEIESHRDAVAEGKEGNKTVHDNAIRKLFVYDQYRAVKEWGDTQKVEAVTKILDKIEGEEWQKNMQLARKSSQETPPSVASAETRKTSGQVSVDATESTASETTSPNALTTEIISKEGKGKAKRGVAEILSDVNESLGVKGEVGDLKVEEKQREARARLRNDVRKMSEAAKEANLELPEFMKQLGIKKEDIDKLLVYAPVSEKKASPTVFDGSDPIIKQRNLGSQKNPRYAPALTESDRAGIKGLKNIETGIFGDATVNPIYSFKELGQWAMDKFYWPIVNAHDAAKREYIVIEKEIKDIKKSLPYASAKRIGTYAVSLQEHGMAKLKAMKVKEVPTLTDAEISAYKKMRGLYKQYYERIQEARLLAGKELFPETKDYFTFVHEISFLDKLGLNPILGKKEALRRTIDLDVAKSIHLKATRFGSEKKRINALYNMNLDAFNIFLRYSDVALNHIHKSPEIAKMREMLLRFPKEKGEQVGFKLSEHAPNTHSMITEWLDYQAGQKPFTRLSKAPLVENTLKALNRNLTFAILSASLRSIAIQPSSLHAVVVDIGTGYVKRGVFELFDKDRVAFAMKNSKHLVSREFDVNVADASRSLLETASNIKQAAGDIGMAPMKYVDLKAATATWLGAYAKAIEVDKMNHAEAVQFADYTTITTQASALPMDVSPMQRTTIGKTATIFQTFTINHWNWINNNMLDMRGDKLSKKEIAKKIATYVTAATLINVLYEDILGMNSPLPSPINAGLEALEEGEDFLGVTKRIGWELATLVPFLGGARYGSTPLGATVDLIGDVAEEGLTTRNAGKLLGVPGSQQMIRLSKGEI